MLNTNRGGLDRQSDSVWSKMAMERTLAISGLIGSSPKILAVVEQQNDVASMDCAVLIPPGDPLSNVMETACPQRTRGALR
jgi:hypothetical protein